MTSSIKNALRMTMAALLATALLACGEEGDGGECLFNSTAPDRNEIEPRYDGA